MTDAQIAGSGATWQFDGTSFSPSLYVIDHLNSASCPRFLGYPTQRLAERALDRLLFRINDPGYRPSRVATVAEFAERWKEQGLSQRKPSTTKAAESHLRACILPRLGKLRLEHLGVESQQIFVGYLSERVSRKTVLNVVGTLSSMLNTARN